MSMKGNHIIFPNNLQGKSINNFNKSKIIPLPVNKLKKSIINNFIIPIHLNNWTSIKENFFLLDKIQQKINKYKDNYDNHDLEIYEHLITFIKNIFDQHNEFQELESKLYGKNTLENNLATLIYKTPTIRLKPEYEIYNLIFGKPDKKNQETYNMSYINEIQQMLSEDDVTFEKIKNKITINNIL